LLINNKEEHIMTSLTPRPFREIYSLFDVSRAKQLGAGGFGKVYLIQHKTNRRKYAAKYQKLNSSKMQKLVHDEASFLKELSDGKRVVDIFDYYEKDRHSLLVLEYLEGGELFSRVGASDYDLTEEKCKKFTINLIKALNYIHERHIIHLDLKPQNIMMKNKTDEFSIKLIDFGLAKRLERGKVRTGFVGTVGFMAPEIARSQYGGHEKDFASTATDLFSLGVILYMLVSGGMEPFWDGNDVRAIKNTLRKEVSFDHHEFYGVSQQAKDFIKRLLEKQQSRRMTGQQCLGHRWLHVDRSEVDGMRREHRMETRRMRRFVARYRWKKAIKAVRMLVKAKNQFSLPNHDD